MFFTKKTIFILFLSLILPLLAKAESLADKSYGNVTVSRVTSIYDADTFRVDIDTWPAVIGERMPVRINGIDAPEIRGKCKTEKVSARAAKQFVVEQLRRAKVIELRNIRRGKYFRLLADVFVDGKSLGEMLIERGLARPYDGGIKLGWCK